MVDEFTAICTRFSQMAARQSGEQGLLLVNFRIYARRSPEGAQRSSELYCPVRKNYELAQKNETECFQVLNMASLTRRNLQAISLLPDMLWLLEIKKFMRYCWIMVKDSLLKLIGYIFRLFFIDIAGRSTELQNHFVLRLSKAEI